VLLAIGYVAPLHASSTQSQAQLRLSFRLVVAEHVQLISQISAARCPRAVGLEKRVDLEELLAGIDQLVCKGDEPG
jgi:hypothetical protein